MRQLIPVAIGLGLIIGVLLCPHLFAGYAFPTAELVLTLVFGGVTILQGVFPDAARELAPFSSFIIILQCALQCNWAAVLGWFLVMCYEIGSLGRK